MSATPAENLFRKEWEEIESEGTPPKYLRNVVVEDFSEFRKKVFCQEPHFARSFVESIYSGDLYVFKRAFPSEFMVGLRGKLLDYSEKRQTSFHKLLDGCPDFHNVITPAPGAPGKTYAVSATKHAYFFYPWNSDPLQLFPTCNERWGILNYIGGSAFDEYIHNIPSDGWINRIQIALYPSGGGGVEAHSDPYKYQRLLGCCIMSKRGRDYQTGGVYALNQKKERVDLEDQLDIGDIYTVYASVHHGVATIDKGGKVDWAHSAGRWWMALSSVASDACANRETWYPVSELAETK